VRRRAARSIRPRAGARHPRAGGGDVAGPSARAAAFLMDQRERVPGSSGSSAEHHIDSTHDEREPPGRELPGTFREKSPIDHGGRHLVVQGGYAASGRVTAAAAYVGV
jgi:hypothetical protein